MSGKQKAMMRVVSAAVCVALLFGGCTGGSDREEVTTTATTTTTTAPVPTTTLAPSRSTASQVGEILVNSPTGRRPDAAALARLSEICRGNGNKLSIYYKDLETGYSLEYRADQNYQAASVIKAPYIKYLLASGEADLGEQLTYRTRKGGATYIEDHFRIGDTLPVKQVMEYTLRYSDNAGYWMLNRRYDFEGFRAYGKSLGCHPKQCTEYQFYYLTARESGLYFENIARYIAAGGERAELLREWLTTTTETRQLPDAFAGRYTVAHKYGEQGNQAYHDAAIVYAPHPYVLAVMSTLEPYTDKSIGVFHEIAELVDTIQTGFYPA